MPEKKPTRTADLDYFYGQSSELFSFYRIPKLLFQDSRFQPLSTDAKTLYGILLDRMSLSARNGWLDKAGRVFIIYRLCFLEERQHHIHHAYLVGHHLSVVFIGEYHVRSELAKW